MGNKTIKEYFLKFGGERSQKLGVPLLPAFYSYLLKLSGSVGLVDVYPWLAELIFHSYASSRNGDKKAINVIAFFIDDQKDNIANVMYDGNPTEEEKTVVWKDDFARYCYYALRNLNDRNLYPRIFVVDTYGNFSDQKSLNDYLDHSIDGVSSIDNTSGNGPSEDLKYNPLYTRSALAGAGNPARMLQKFSAIGYLDKVPKASNNNASGGNTSEFRSLGELNCFIFNSITYLTRTIGFREAMHLVRAIMERGVWKPNPIFDESGSGNLLQDKNGLLFAILHQGVHSDDQIRYAETFFDGVISFDSLIRDKRRFISYSFKQFPPIRESDIKNKSATKMYPIFGIKYIYEPVAGKRLHVLERVEEKEQDNGRGEKNPEI